MAVSIEQVSESPAPQSRINIDMPDNKVAGHYADFAGVWHTNETFVLDFMALKQPPHPDPDQPGQMINDAQIVARVRVPAAQVWEIMRALEQQYSGWEIEQGRRPPRGGVPPGQ